MMSLGTETRARRWKHRAPMQNARHVWKATRDGEFLPVQIRTRRQVYRSMIERGVIEGDEMDEVYGLLWGLFGQSSAPTRYDVEIFDFEPVELLDNSPVNAVVSYDAIQRATRILEARNGGEGMVLGWYHTHPGWGVFFSEEDFKLTHNAFFGKPWQVGLVIDPKAGVAGYFVWEGPGRLDCSRASWREFDFAAAADFAPTSASATGDTPDATPAPGSTSRAPRERITEPGADDRGRRLARLVAGEGAGEFEERSRPPVERTRRKPRAPEARGDAPSASETRGRGSVSSPSAELQRWRRATLGLGVMVLVFAGLWLAESSSPAGEPLPAVDAAPVIPPLLEPSPTPGVPEEPLPAPPAATPARTRPAGAAGMPAHRPGGATRSAGEEAVEATAAPDIRQQTAATLVAEGALQLGPKGGEHHDVVDSAFAETKQRVAVVFGVGGKKSSPGEDPHVTSHRPEKHSAEVAQIAREVAAENPPADQARRVDQAQIRTRRVGTRKLLVGPVFFSYGSDDAIGGNCWPSQESARVLKCGFDTPLPCGATVEVRSAGREAGDEKTLKVSIECD